MSIQANHYQLLRLGGLFVWVCVAIPLLVSPFLYGLQIPKTEYLWWALCQLSYGLAYWILVRDLRDRKPDAQVYLILLILTVTSLGVSFFSMSGLGAILGFVHAGVLPWVMRRLNGVIWVLVQNLLLIPIFMRLPDASLTQAILMSGVFLGFAGFTYMMSLIARQQFRARDELRAINAQLRATQALLSESSKASERLRISRDLHDLVGHHLTALSLNLEVAMHLADGKALSAIEQAQSVAKLLLTDVREVVSDLRHQDTLNLKKAIEQLVEGVPSIKINLQMPDQFNVPDTHHAQVLLRTVQESITNCVRHAQAKNLHIRFEQLTGKIQISIEDDGLGSQNPEPGNGLKGMQERIEKLNGSLEFKTALGQGFLVKICLPVENQND